MRDTTRDVLTIFVEASDKLDTGGLFQFYKGGGEISFAFTVDRETGEMIDLGYAGPSEDAVTGAAVKARILLLNRDALSLKKLADVSNDPALSPAWKEGLARIREETERVLDEPVDLPISPRTCRHIFHTFTYGDLLHYDQDKRQELKAWEQAPYFPRLQFAFVSTVSALDCQIHNLAELAEEELSN